MDTDGARRLNRSSPSSLNSGTQRTDFFHGLIAAVQVRDLAANTLEAAAAELRHAHQDHRVRDLVERALRRLSRTADS